jgi:hypothetical protein
MFRFVYGIAPLASSEGGFFYGLAATRYGMASFNYNWDSAFTATSIAASSITNTSSATTAQISNDNKSACEVSVKIIYGGTASEGVKVYLLRPLNDTPDYETLSDAPWGFMMPFAVSATHWRIFSVPPQMVAAFKVQCVNNSGATITATISYRQATIDQS